MCKCSVQDVHDYGPCGEDCRSNLDVEDVGCEDITEWAMVRYHWQQKSATGERLRSAISTLADQYGFTTSERMELGAALQAFVDDLLAVRERQKPIVKWQRPDECPEWWEGRQVWEWRKGSPVKLALAPLGYSRAPEHCTGIWWQLADVPIRPAYDEEKSN